LSRRPDIGHLDDLLIRAVRLRNFLAHEYVHERAAAFLTEVGKDDMIGELKKATAFFEAPDARLESLTRQLTEAIGVNKHMPEAMGAPGRRASASHFPVSGRRRASCRSTRISASFEVSIRARSTSKPRNRTMSR
jgi:hypothetical protein